MIIVLRIHVCGVKAPTKSAVLGATQNAHAQEPHSRWRRYKISKDACGAQPMSNTMRPVRIGGGGAIWRLIAYKDHDTALGVQALEQARIPHRCCLSSLLICKP